MKGRPAGALVLKLSVVTPPEKLGSGLEDRCPGPTESFFFHTQSETCSIRTRHQTTAPLMSVSSPAAVGAFELAETKPDNCRKPTVWRSVGAADRWLTGMCVIKGRERESAPGQSGCDRGAAVPLRPDTSYRWLTAGRPCLAVRSRSGAQQEPRAADIVYWMCT